MKYSADQPKIVGSVRPCLPLAPSSILFHVLWRGAGGVRRRGKVALVEGPHLLLRERANNGMQNTAVVEDDEVLRLPVVRVDKLKQNQSRTTTFVRRRDSPAAQ